MATSSGEKSGILLIFEADGVEWTNHLAGLLQSEPYRIPCVTEHWWNLSSKLADTHPVHVLLLTPLIEASIKHEKFSCLRNDSNTSLLLECNVDSSDIDMTRWLFCEKVDTSLEKQRHLLATLVDMYEMATNDEESFDEDEYVDIDIVPKTIYPGESTIFILFSSAPAGEVSIKVFGIKTRLLAKKYTKCTYTCDLPEVGEGQKLTSVFVEGIPHSVFTTRLVIVTPEAILENFIGNFENVLGFRRKSDILKTGQKMGLFFNPFSEFQCSAESLKSFVHRINRLAAEPPIQERDSGLGMAPGENYYDTIAGNDDFQRRHAQIMDDNNEFLRGSTRSAPDEKHIGRSKSSVFGNIFKKMFRKENQYKQNPRKLSRRSAKAHAHEITHVPELPRQTRKYSATDNWMFKQRSPPPPPENW